MNKYLTTIHIAVLTLLLVSNVGLSGDRRRGGADIPKGGYDSLTPWLELGNLKTLEG